MTQNIIQITDSNSLSIAREIRDDHKQLHENLQALEDNYEKSRLVIIENFNKKSYENLERIRLSMSLPVLENPHIDSRYIDYNVAFILHGPMPRMPNIMDLLNPPEPEKTTVQ